MLTKNLRLENFKGKKISPKIKIQLKEILNHKNEIIRSLEKNYKNKYSKKTISKFNKFKEFCVIGMGGSILGSKAIYNFLNHKIKKKFSFIDNLNNVKFETQAKKRKINLIISKSGNTLETLSNANILIKKKDKNLFITENKDSYLMNLAKKLKSDIVHHNDFIGGRYSVLSEVGMLPAELMGLKQGKFKKFNSLIKNKSFLNSLVVNVSNTFYLIKKKRFNSIILNYDDRSSGLFYWYQQLIAESLGKKKKGLLPIVSLMPRDNHSLMQLYLDGFQNNFFTFFFVEETIGNKINNANLLNSHLYLKNKSLNKILESQYQATKNIFKKQNLPFRNFFIKRRNEETLGELFTFFILETILLSKVMKVNAYDQPAVELIKKETKKKLIS